MIPRCPPEPIHKRKWIDTPKGLVLIQDTASGNYRWIGFFRSKLPQPRASPGFLTRYSPPDIRPSNKCFYFADAERWEITIV
jgi:hypothetical protein